jgi:hypothetical protein
MPTFKHIKIKPNIFLMGCLFSKKQDVLLSQTNIPEIGQYVDIFESNIKYHYTNPIHSDSSFRDNVVI